MLNSCEAAVEITAVNKVVLFILLHEVILKLRSFWNLRVETCRYSNKATDYFFHVVKLFTQAIHRIFYVLPFVTKPRGMSRENTKESLCNTNHWRVIFTRKYDLECILVSLH